MGYRKWIAVVAVLAVAACSEEEGRRVPLGQDTAQSADRRASWPAELTARVDSANAAIANDEPAAAAEIYRELAQEYPEIGTVWFGLYMAERALGNEDAAQQALDRAGGLSGAAPMHGTGGDTSGAGDAATGSGGGRTSSG